MPPGKAGEETAAAGENLPADAAVNMIAQQYFKQQGVGEATRRRSPSNTVTKTDLGKRSARIERGEFVRNRVHSVARKRHPTARSASLSWEVANRRRQR